MLDSLGILFSTVMILIVVFRAVRLDRTRAWFQTLKDDAASSGKVRARYERR